MEQRPLVYTLDVSQTRIFMERARRARKIRRVILWIFGIALVVFVPFSEWTWKAVALGYPKAYEWWNTAVVAIGLLMILAVIFIVLDFLMVGSLRQCPCCWRSLTSLWTIPELPIQCASCSMTILPASNKPK